MNHSAATKLADKLKKPIVARLSRGLGAHGITQVLNLVIRFAEIPLLIGAWGTSGYGVWLMVTALPTALSLSDGGFTKTARREMTIRSGRSDSDGVCSAFQNTWVILAALSTVVIITISTVTPLLPITEWLKIDSIDNSTLSLILIFLTTSTLVNFQISLLCGVFTAQKEYATAELHMASIFGFSFLLLVITVLMGGDMMAAAAANLFGIVAGYLIMLTNVYRKTGKIWYGLKYVSIAELKYLAKPSLANLAFPLGEAINLQGMRVIIGVTLGPVALASFSSLRTLCRAVLQPVMAISRTAEPEISLAYGSGDMERMKKIFILGQKATIAGSLFLSLILSTIAPWVYTTWTRSEIPFNWEIFAVLTASSIAAAVGAMALVVPCALNKPLDASRIYLSIQTLGCTLVAWVLISTTGLSGAGVSVLLVDICVALAMLKMSKKLLRSDSPQTTALL